MIDCEDEIETGLIRDDRAYSAALRTREDIFSIDKAWLLPCIEATALILAILTCVWLTFAKPLKVAPDFYQKIMRTQTVRLLRNESQASARESQSSEKQSREPLRRQVSGGSGEQEKAQGFSMARYGSKRKQNGIALFANATKHLERSEVRNSKSRENEIPAEMIPSDSGEDVKGLMAIANANKTEGNRSEAFAAFRRVLKQNPHNTAALAGMGDLFLYTGILDSAAAFYAAAAAQNPRIASVHNGLGSTRYYLSVMAANPNFVRLRKIPDPARYIKEQYDSSITEYTMAISLDSSRVDALTNRGVIRDLNGDHAEALADYTRAIRIKSTYAEAYSKRAGTYKELGDLKDALADYTAAIKLDTASYEFDPALHFANAYFGRGNVEFQMGNYNSAILDFDSTLRLSPHHSIAMLNKARAFVDIKRLDSAIVWYSTAISILSPTEYGGAQERGYFGRGVAYILADQPALALKDFNDAIRLKPDDRYAHFHRGNVFKILTRYDDAIADYLVALESPALAAKACWRIAECYALKKDKLQALDWLRKSGAHGFTTFKLWKQDRDLASLWDDKDFRELTK